MGKPKALAACVHCRQMKMRCNAPESFPAPCVRCLRKNLSCFIDPSFKRIPKRGRLDAVERELRELKRHLHPEPTPTSAAQRTSPSPEEYESPVPRAPTPPHLQVEFPDLGFNRVIGEVSLDPPSALAIVHKYYAHYHMLFPIAPPLEALLRSYDEDPILFWAVIAIASREDPQHAYFQGPLKEEIAKYIADACVPAKQSVRLVQALLVLCTWPFPFDATSTDRSWTYCGLSVTCAYSKGLHRADHAGDYDYNAVTNSTAIIERKVTWIACFITSQRLSTLYGFPSLVSPDYVIHNAIAVQPAWLAKQIWAQLYVAYQSFKFVSVLGNSYTHSSGLVPDPTNAIRTFDMELRGKEPHLIPTWQQGERIYFLATKLQLYSFAFNCTTGNTEQDHEGAIFSNAYVTAMNLLQVAAQSADSLLRWPMYQVQYIVYAIFFILKLTECSPDTVDSLAWRNILTQIWELLRNISNIDHISRACDIIKFLSIVELKQIEPLPQPVLSRGAANLGIELIWRARQRFSNNVRLLQPADYTSAAATEGLFTDLQGLFMSTFSDVQW